MSTPVTEVHGASTFSKPAPPHFVFLSLLTDLALWGVFLLSLLNGRFIFLTVGKLRWIHVSLFFVVIELLALLFLRQTFGMWLWKVKRRPHFRFLTIPGFNTSDLLQGVVSLGLLLGMMTWQSYRLKQHHPVFMDWNSTTLQSQAPTANENWKLYPYFYAAAAVPLTPFGKNILPRMSYSPGPPSRFISKVQFLVQSPGTWLTWEGPRTPEGLSPSEIAKCFTKEAFDRECIPFREHSLARVIEEIDFKIRPNQWSVQRVQEKDLEGILIKTQNKDEAEWRLIVFSPRGALQVVGVGCPAAEACERAESFFMKHMRSIRVFPGVEENRNLINRLLMGVNLQKLVKEAKQMSLENLERSIVEIQLLLLSKISVEPQAIEAYHHLGGLSLLLLRSIHESKRSDYSETASFQKGLIFAALRYASDIDKDSPLTSELQRQWEESKNY